MFSLVAIAIALVGWVAPAAAQKDKPKIAILGLEVIDGGAGIDAATTQFAKALTDAMRVRPNSNSGPYLLAPSSTREFIDLKAIAGCDEEGKDKDSKDKYRECIAGMGNNLKTDFLVYGKVERGKTGYQVVLFLMQVSSKQIAQRIPDSVPYNESTGLSVTSWGKNLYGRLVGAATQGSVMVRSSAQRGTVLVNGKARGSLVAGEFKITGLTEGSYEIAVDAEGRPRFSQTVSVIGGEDVTVSAMWADTSVKPADKNPDSSNTGAGTLQSREGLVSRDRSSGKGLWKGMFFGGLAVAAGGGGFWAYSFNKMNDERPVGTNPDGQRWSDSDCGKGFAEVADSCNQRRNTGIGMGLVAVGGTMAAVGFYFAYIRESGSSERSASHRKTRDRVVVTPIVAADGAGAMVRFDF
ncbi:MAG: hypothetical protein KBG15_09965 [Kofleriaceae bacterium]|nr:hypothetical protein [Kofleriaceae bacterium]